MVHGAASDFGSRSGVLPAASMASMGLESSVSAAALSIGGSMMSGGLGGKHRQPSSSPTDRRTGKRHKLSDTSYYTLWLVDILNNGMDMSVEEQSTEAALDTGLTVWYREELPSDCNNRWRQILSLVRGMLEPVLFCISARI